MKADRSITITGLRVRAAVVPRPRPLIFHTARFTESPLVLIDLETDAGITGCAYLFGYHDEAVAPLVSFARNLAPVVTGETLAPAELTRKLAARFRYFGMQGLAQIVASGIDMAAWDALAKAAGLPLAALLGYAPRPLPSYDSTGLGGPESVAGEARELDEAGFGTVKIKLGYATGADDVAVIRAIREAVPRMALMVDYNQRLSMPEATARMGLLEPEGLLWIEEPVEAADLEGHAALARDFRTPVQLGENWWNVYDMTRAAAARAGDCAMLDVGRIGGVTGWMQCAAVAEAYGLPLSSHFYPEISGQLMCASPTAHWLEFLEWASPILVNPVAADKGRVMPSTTPGTGVEWDETAVARYEVTIS
ncbi:MAG: mandelate racemase [Alphaproteobacteria bacterium]|nr:mandelate racemase [Alphaproteobacteria bacterium]